MKFCIRLFFENLLINFSFCQNWILITVSFFVGEKCFVQNLQIILLHILCSIRFVFLLENRAVYEIMWKSMVDPNRSQMTICGIFIACWIPKARDTHSEYVIFIAVPLKHWLHKPPSTLL
jgi:hypothetical protein